MSDPEAEFPRRSKDGLAALDIFYAGFNDVNFYVEDIDQENLYEVILRKIFPHIAISRIFPLGGKSAVLQHADCGTNDALSSYRAYILDKDFDDLLGKKVNRPNIFYLERYCIENYLIEEEAVIEVALESNPKNKRPEIAARLDLGFAIQDCYERCKALFILFYCVHHFDLGIRNTISAPEAFCEPKRLWLFNAQKLSVYETEVYRAADTKSIAPPLSDWKTDSRLMHAVNADTHCVVSGKFAAAMLFHYVNAKYNLGSMTFDSFIFRLAKNCSLLSLDDFGKNIRAKVVEYEASVSRR